MNYYKLSLKDRAAFYANALILKPLKVNRFKRTSQKRQLAKIIIDAIQNNISSQQLASNLGHHWNDFTVDWDWITHHILTDSFNIKTAKYIEDHQGKDALVYKKVYREDCLNCQKVYLENAANGIDSKPKLYKLSDLIKNGHNLKFNLKKYRPVIGTTIFSYNPDIEGFNWDFSTLRWIMPGQEWDDEKKQFLFKEVVPKTKQDKMILEMIRQPGVITVTENGETMSFDDWKKKK